MSTASINSNAPRPSLPLAGPQETAAPTVDKSTVSFSDTKKTLHTHARFSLASPEFQAKFSDPDSVRQRVQGQKDAATGVKQAIDGEFGSGTADRLMDFQRPSTLPRFGQSIG